MGPFVYVIFSSTPNRIGSMIRSFTKEEFNHVSISLDPELKEMYSFARRYYATPLYGGFVRETPSRYCVAGQSARVQVCRLPVNQDQYDNLTQQLQHMLGNRQHYLYNHLSILAAKLGRSIHTKDAYTCVEFCVECLHLLGLPVTPGQYYTVGDLQQLLQDKVIYDGMIPNNTEHDAEYYMLNPVRYPLLHTLRDMIVLISRIQR